MFDYEHVEIVAKSYSLVSDLDNEFFVNESVRMTKELVDALELVDDINVFQIESPVFFIDGNINLTKTKKYNKEIFLEKYKDMKTDLYIYVVYKGSEGFSDTIRYCEIER